MLELNCFIRQILIILIIFIIVAFIIISYDLYKNDYETTPEQAKNWKISHFVLYMILGFLFPDMWIFLIITGIMWEYIEHAIGIFYGPKKKWWKGSSSDVICNIYGILIGMILHIIIFDISRVKRPFFIFENNIIYI